MIKSFIYAFTVLLFVSSIAWGQQPFSSFDWANNYGGKGYDRATSVTADLYDNSYVTGYFRDTLIIADSMYVSQPNSVFIVKLDCQGGVEWSNYFGGPRNTYCYSIDVDVMGNTYITGEFLDSVSFGNIKLYNEDYYGAIPFFAKLNPNGEFEWATRLGGVHRGTGNQLKIDGEGNVYVTGRFSGLPEFGSTTLTSQANTDVFIAKIDTNGEFLWASQTKGGGSDSSADLNIDDSGNVYVSGAFNQTMTLGNIVLYRHSSYDSFITKLNPQGQFVWANNVGGTGIARAAYNTIDSQGNTYISAQFSNTAYFDNDSLISDGGFDVYIAKLNPNGEFVWQKQIEGSGDQWSNSIAMDSNDNLYVLGSFGMSEITIGETSLTGTYSADGSTFLTKLDTLGNYQWAKHFQDNGPSYENRMMISINDMVLFAGRFKETLKLGDIELESNGSSDAFIARINELTHTVNSYSVCSGEEIMVNGNTYSETGTYTDVFQTIDGCDSTVVTILEVFDETLDTSVLQDGETLTAVEEDATYQWIDCSDNSPIAGATGQSFTATTGGNYAVILTSTICENTSAISDCEVIEVSGLTKLDVVSYEVYPNPTNHTFSISGLSGNETLMVYDINGSLIEAKIVNQEAEQINVETLAKGIYLLKINSINGLTTTLKVVKN